MVLSEVMYGNASLMNILRLSSQKHCCTSPKNRKPNISSGETSGQRIFKRSLILTLLVQTQAFLIGLHGYVHPLLLHICGLVWTTVMEPSASTQPSTS